MLELGIGALAIPFDLETKDSPVERDHPLQVVHLDSDHIQPGTHCVDASKLKD